MKKKSSVHANLNLERLVDNSTLDRILNDKSERQFWLKPIGLPGQPLYQHSEVFPELSLDITFTARPRIHVDVGDIIVGYRTGYVRLIYVAECLERVREFTAEEKQENHWRERDSWHCTARNLTPQFGGVCTDYRLNPFAIAREFNSSNADTPVGLGAIKFGTSVLRLPRTFAEVLIRRIRELDCEELRDRAE